MNVEYALTGQNLKKRFKSFELNIPKLQIPKGFSTALIGENGAGKTTLLNILSGIRLDYTGELKYFGQYSDEDRENGKVKEQIGYTGPGHYYLPHWSIKDIEDINQLLFETFDVNKFRQYCKELGVFPGGYEEKSKKVSTLSDGMKVKVMLANVLARDTRMLIMDEPASPLDPLMRDQLCQLIREYLVAGEGENTVFFSTHNISDMENVTDYAIIMEHGTIAEAGFVEALKEKYVLVKGEKEQAEVAKGILFSMTENPYGFEGICLADSVDKLAGMNVSLERPSLYQISVAVMKVHSGMVIR